MLTVNILEAQTDLVRLVDQAANGKSFIISKAGKPLVQVIKIDSPANPPGRRLGFLAGKMAVPDDFDQMGCEEIGQLFCEEK